jgi:hypothetical protein
MWNVCYIKKFQEEFIALRPKQVHALLFAFTNFITLQSDMFNI